MRNGASLLCKLGYQVTAATGKLDETDNLRSPGAAGKPLQKERWAAVVDPVGSRTLANALAQTRYGGLVAACGLAQGFDLPATVMPFSLRGIILAGTLAGIASVMAPIAARREAWARLAVDLDPAKLAAITERVPLIESIAKAHALMQGQVRSRIVVKV